MLCIALTVAFILLPGNEVRKNAEVIRWMPYYDMYSLPEKTVWGICFAFQKLGQYFSLHMAMAAGAVWVHCHLSANAAAAVRTAPETTTERTPDTARERSAELAWKRPLSSLLLLYYLLQLVNQIGIGKTLTANAGNPLAWLFVFPEMSSGMFFFSLKNCIAFILAFAAYFSLCFLLLQTDLVSGLFTAGGFCTCAMMAFSPTIYVSGERTAFLFGAFLLMAVMRETASATVKMLQNLKQLP